MKRLFSLLILALALQGLFADTITDPCAYGVCDCTGCWNPPPPSGACESPNIYAPGC
jgi:hypothetical protein